MLTLVSCVVLHLQTVSPLASVLQLPTRYKLQLTQAALHRFGCTWQYSTVDVEYYIIYIVAYRYIRKLIGRKKGREIMQNGREGGERQIYVNRQRRMKCQKFWWKSGSHKNRDISGILQYFAKPFLDLHRRMNGLHLLLISFFKDEYTAKSDGN